MEASDREFRGDDVQQFFMNMFGKMVGGEDGEWDVQGVEVVCDDGYVEISNIQPRQSIFLPDEQRGRSLMELLKAHGYIVSFSMRNDTLKVRIPMVSFERGLNLDVGEGHSKAMLDGAVDHRDFDTAIRKVMGDERIL